MKPNLIDEEPRSDFQSSTAPNSEFWARKSYENLGLRVGFLGRVLGFSLERFERNERMKSNAKTPNSLM